MLGLVYLFLTYKNSLRLLSWGPSGLSTECSQCSRSFPLWLFRTQMSPSPVGTLGLFSSRWPGLSSLPSLMESPLCIPCLTFSQRPKWTAMHISGPHSLLPALSSSHFSHLSLSKLWSISSIQWDHPVLLRPPRLQSRKSSAERPFLICFSYLCNHSPYCLTSRLKEEIHLCSSCSQWRASPVPVTPLWPEVDAPLHCFTTFDIVLWFLSLGFRQITCSHGLSLTHIGYIIVNEVTNLFTSVEIIKVLRMQL